MVLLNVLSCWVPPMFLILPPSSLLSIFFGSSSSSRCGRLALATSQTPPFPGGPRLHCSQHVNPFLTWSYILVRTLVLDPRNCACWRYLRRARSSLLFENRPQHDEPRDIKRTSDPSWGTRCSCPRLPRAPAHSHRLLAVVPRTV